MIKKKFNIFIPLIPIICSIILIIHFIQVKYYNMKLENKFVLSSQFTDYQDNVPIENIDFNKIINKYLFIDGMFSYPDFILDKDIYYYEKPDSHSPVKYKLTKGERYYISGSMYAGLNLRTYSWPTYKKNWRYALPLLSKTDYENLLTFEDDMQSYAYITLDDLVYILQSYFQQYGYLYTNADSEKDFSTAGLYVIDNVLYENGIYISPDLYHYYWNWQYIVCVFVLIISVLITIRFKRKASIALS